MAFKCCRIAGIVTVQYRNNSRMAFSNKFACDFLDVDDTNEPVSFQERERQKILFVLIVVQVN